METQGFYKKDNDILLCGPNYIINENYNLYKEQKDSYSYPIGGWYWFDDEDSAYEFFGLEKPVEEIIEDPYLNPDDPDDPPLL